MPESAKPNSSCADLPPELANHPKYGILRELGRGGMGVVYQARHKDMDRQVVIKVINRALLERPGALERFLREVRAAALLSHPNIVTAYDAERIGDAHMLVMEFVPGQSLAEIVQKRGPLPIAFACHFARQVALGLQHAHERSLVHRDIKPQNLMLTLKNQVKILDFGLAKVVREEAESTGLTAHDSCMGTPDYCAPEQALNARRADIRADLYSLGCTLYYLLSGRPPFREDTMVAKFLAHQQQQPRPLPELRVDVPAELWRVVSRLLAKEPGQRYQKPVEVAQALAPFVKGASKPLSAPTLPKGGQHVVAPQAVPETIFEGDGPSSGALKMARPRRSRKSLVAALAVLPLLAGVAGLCIVLMLTARPVAPGSPEKPQLGDSDKREPSEKPDRRFVARVKEVAGIDLVQIPAGEFNMGSEKSDADAFDDEKPRHKVRISGSFWLGKYKVTFGQFKRFVGATDYETEAEKDKDNRTWRERGLDRTDEHPVVRVSWNDAKAYCAWLAEKTGSNVRLPREAEWEYSCRVRSTTKYYFGDNVADLNDYAWYKENTKPYGTRPCGQKKPNAFGLYDMHGLVWEWCDDGKRTYKDEVSDPVGAGASRVIRGGSFDSDPQNCRAANRNDRAPAYRYHFIGFRVVVRR